VLNIRKKNGSCRRPTISVQITASFYPRLSFVLLQIEQKKKKTDFWQKMI